MNKKIIIISLVSIVSVIITGLIIGIIVSDKNNITPSVNNHEHNIEKIIIDPTCENKGYTKNYCTECDYFYEDSFIDKIEHNITFKVVKKATCKEEGLEEGICKMCKQTFTQILYKVDHSELVTNVTNTYCNDKKVVEIMCNICNQTVEIIGHKYETTIVEPTCTEKGKKVTTCIDCGDRSEIILSETGHLHFEEIINYSTCEKEGTSYIFCTDCGEILSSKTIEKIEHNLISTKVDNLIKYSCKNCNYTYEVENVENSYKLTLISNLDNSIEEIEFPEGSVPTLPILLDEDYDFSGWYYEKDGINIYNNIPLYEDTTLYGVWYKETITTNYDENTIERNVDESFKFYVTSDVVLTNSNVQDYIKITDINDKNVTINVLKKNNKYVISSNNYEEGNTYCVSVTDKISLVNRSGNQFYFSIKKENVNDVVYKDNVIVLNINDLEGIYTNNDIIYIYAEQPFLTHNQICVIEDEDNNLLGAYKVNIVGVMAGYYEYQCENASAEETFDKLEVYHSGVLELDEEFISYTLEEDLEREFRKSPLYKQYNDAVDEFMKLEQNKKYRVSKPIIKPDCKLVDGGIQVSLEVKVTFSEGQEKYLSVILKVENRITFDLDIDASLTPLHFNSIVETHNQLGISLYAYVEEDKIEGEKEDPATLETFKQIYKALVKKEKVEVKEDAGEDKSRIKIYEGSFAIYGPIIAKLGLYANFEWKTVGEFGVSFTYHTTVTEIINIDLNGVEAQKSVENSSSFSAVLMGKFTASATAEISLSIGVAAIGTVGLSVEAGPMIELGGMISINMNQNRNLNMEGAFYGKVGAFVKLNFVFESDILNDFKKELLRKEYLIIDFGKTEVALNFEKLIEDTININTNFNDEIYLNEYVDTNAIVKDFDSFASFTKKVNCSYYLDKNINNKGNYINLTKDGKLTILPSKDNVINLKVKVVYGNLQKDVDILINIDHTHEYTETILREVTCTSSGSIEYTCSCGLKYKETIYPKGHNFIDYICSVCGSEEKYKDEFIIDDFVVKKIENNTYEVVEYKGDETKIFIPGGNDIINITTISSDIFRSYNLITEIELGEGILYIDDNAFSNFTNLEKIILPSSLKEIGSFAFSDCINLESIKIPNNVKVLEHSTFLNCKNLYSIEFGSSIKEIKEDVFKGCESLTDMLYDSTIENWCNIKFINEYSSPMWIGSYFCMDDGFGEYVDFPEITIPDSVSELGDYQFYGFRNVISITIPETILKIGQYCFAECKCLKEINIPSGLEEIPYYAFQNCDAITSLIVPSNIKIICEGAFFNCDNLSSLEVQEGVTTIKGGAFSYNISLTDVNIASSVTSIAAGAFLNCNSEAYNYYYGGIYIGTVDKPYKVLVETTKYQISSFRIHEDTDTIYSWGIDITWDLWDQDEYFYISENPLWIGQITGDTLHDTINGITTIYYEGTLEDWCKVKIPSGECNPMTWTNDFRIKNEDGDYVWIDEIIIPDTITSIGDYQFYGLSQTKKIVIPNSVKSIGSYAFTYCLGLSANVTSSIFIPSSVEYIDYGAFYKCGFVLGYGLLGEYEELVNNITLKCQAAYKPRNWDKDWNLSELKVIWDSQ